MTQCVVVSILKKAEKQSSDIIAEKTRPVMRTLYLQNVSPGVIWVDVAMHFAT
jgi:hypothetical protein